MARGTGAIKRLQERRAAAQDRRSREAVADEMDRQERLRERITQQLSSQWEQVREARRTEEPVIETGPSNLARAQVPWAVDMAAAWAWRIGVIAVAVLGLLWLAKYFAVVVVPLFIALFIAALVTPVIDLAVRVRIPRKLAALLTVVGGIAVVSLGLTFVGQQVAAGMDDLSTQVVAGLEEIRKWLQDGPLNASDSQISDWIKSAQNTLSEQDPSEWLKRATEVGAVVGHVVAGFFIVLFSTYFFLADGGLIWSWVVRIFPRAARLQADASGRVAWRSLTQFVRATVLVAATDAIGIMIFAAILQVPLISAIGVLVFLGAFVPMIGALISGSVAVLVALVAHGPIVALLMLAGVVFVQQVEAHVLQPFLMGRFVSVHPLGVIIAIACGVLVAGIAGALIAVPLAAALNAVAQHLASYTEVGEPPEGSEGPEPPEGAVGDEAPEADVADRA